MRIKEYLLKMRGDTKSPPRVSKSEICWSWIGAFLGISLVAWIHAQILDAWGVMLMVGSFGATAVLIYGAIRSPLAQPRNVIGGHVVSAVIGVSAQMLLGSIPWLAAAAAAATAIAVMHITRTLHPPGGATALIAVIGGASVHELGYFYALMPVGVGAVALVVVALLVNNIPSTRRYPEFWI